MESSLKCWETAFWYPFWAIRRQLQASFRRVKVVNWRRKIAGCLSKRRLMLFGTCIRRFKTASKNKNSNFRKTNQSKTKWKTIWSILLRALRLLVYRIILGRSNAPKPKVSPVSNPSTYHTNSSRFILNKWRVTTRWYREGCWRSRCRRGWAPTPELALKPPTPPASPPSTQTHATKFQNNSTVRRLMSKRHILSSSLQLMLWSISRKEKWGRISIWTSPNPPTSATKAPTETPFSASTQQLDRTSSHCQPSQQVGRTTICLKMILFSAQQGRGWHNMSDKLENCSHSRRDPTQCREWYQPGMTAFL